MSRLMNSDVLDGHLVVDLYESGDVWIHDNAAFQDIQLNAQAATKLFDVLLLHIERLRKCVQQEKEG